MPRGLARLQWQRDYRQWRAEAWPVAVYLTDEGLLLEGIDPQWEEVRTWILDQATSTGLTPWQVVTRTMMAAQQRTNGGINDNSE